MIKIYYAPNTRAVRIVWLCKELDLDYELYRFESIADSRLREPNYLGVHPLGRVPCLSDGDVRIFESGAITQYILARYGMAGWSQPLGQKIFLHTSSGFIMRKECSCPL